MDGKDNANTNAQQCESVVEEMDTNSSAFHDRDGSILCVGRSKDDTNVMIDNVVDGGNTDNTDILVDQDLDLSIDQEAEDSNSDSGNEHADIEEEEGEEEEESGEYTDQSKTQKKVPGQTVKDSVFESFSFTGDGLNSVESAECVKSLSAESEQWVNRDACNTAYVDTQKQFICIKFPAVIKNKDKALTCLGGIDNIYEASKVGKIDLVFRPDDPYSKPVIGLYKKNSHVLVKCRRRRKVGHENQASTSASSMGDEVDDGYEYKVEVLGIVSGIFKFDRPCDYQYLPVTKKTDGSEGFEELLSDLMIKFEDDRQGFINRDVPLFLPPYVFSRSERPANYIFQNDEKMEEKHIGMARKMRNSGTERVTFASREVPQGPNKYAVEIHKASKTNLDPLKKLFEERPLWSKVAIVARLQAIKKEHLKKYANMVAYSFSTGPWMHLWCRFGYDPRQHKEAKIYQTVDYRIRKAYNRERVVAKRSMMTHQLGRRGLNNIKGHRLPPIDTLGAPKTDENDSESTSQPINVQYQFSPNTMPPHRQMYYQVCDVMQEDIQRLVHLNDGKETVCTERDGWCVPDFLVLSRDILSNHADKLLGTDFGADTTVVGDGVEGEQQEFIE